MFRNILFRSLKRRTFPINRFRAPWPKDPDLSCPKSGLRSKSSFIPLMPIKGLLPCDVLNDAGPKDAGTEPENAPVEPEEATRLPRGLSKSGGSRSGRTSSILVCHEYPLNMSTARPASSAVARRTVP